MTSSKVGRSLWFEFLFCKNKNCLLGFLLLDGGGAALVCELKVCIQRAEAKVDIPNCAHNIDMRQFTCIALKHADSFGQCYCTLSAFPFRFGCRFSPLLSLGCCMWGGIKHAGLRRMGRRYCTQP